MVTATQNPAALNQTAGNEEPVGHQVAAERHHQAGRAEEEAHRKQNGTAEEGPMRPSSARMRKVLSDDY
jgi:hypothetical protein